MNTNADNNNINVDIDEQISYGSAVGALLYLAKWPLYPDRMYHMQYVLHQDHWKTQVQKIMLS